MNSYELRERTKQLALRIIRMFVALPKTDEARVLGKQLLRSGTSVAANYREASRARSDAECWQSWESWNKSLMNRCSGWN